MAPPRDSAQAAFHAGEIKKGGRPSAVRCFCGPSAGWAEKLETCGTAQEPRRWRRAPVNSAFRIPHFACPHHRRSTYAAGSSMIHGVDQVIPSSKFTRSKKYVEKVSQWKPYG